LASVLTGFLVEGGDVGQLDGAGGWVLGTLVLLGLPEAGLGWTRFFLLCTVLAVPGMLLLIWVAPWRAVSDVQGDGSGAPPISAK
jgi:PAT family beta-lactamase induction signal transducer AmpG